MSTDTDLFYHHCHGSAIFFSADNMNINDAPVSLAQVAEASCLYLT